VNQHDIHKTSWRIYRLARHGKIDVAEKILRQLPDDGAIAVATSLVLDDFRMKPWGSCLRLLSTVSLVPGFLVVRSIMGPLGPVDGFQFIVLYWLGVFGGVVLLEFAIVMIFSAIWVGVDVWPWRKTSCTDTSYFSARDIAATTLANIGSRRSDLTGPLLSAMYRYISVHSPVRDELDLALIRNLRDGDLGSLDSLTSIQRVALRLRLALIDTLMTDLLSEPEENQWSVLGTATAPELGCQILHAYERIVDPDAIPVVERISSCLSSAELSSAEWGGVIASAQRCLPILQENVDRVLGNEQLLRGSAGPTSNSAELLRAVNEGDAERPDELLRPDGPI